MDARAAERWFDELLEAKRFLKTDDSVNGLQVGDHGSNVERAAFAVDASLETMKRAKERGADILVVHHGIFWNKGETVTGAMRERVKFLLDSGLSLFAYHLPLDAHPRVGNNAVLARELGLVDLVPFAEYKGMTIGFMGRFPSPKPIEEILSAALPDGSPPLAFWPFGKRECLTCGVVSGGAPEDGMQAIDLGLDAFVTGDASHTMYHHALESGLNMISAGHYATETHGPKALALAFNEGTGIPSFFIDMPTGF